MDTSEAPAPGASADEKMSVTNAPMDVSNGTGNDSFYLKTGDDRPGYMEDDRRDMYRLGKTQELKRSYPSFAAFSFSMVLTAMWEFLLMANTQGMIDGGLPGLFWSYIWTFIGFGFVILSIAEMASMAPTAGGQYHWVSEFAPPRLQKILSYFTGWMATLSWQAGTASGPFLTGTIIQSLAAINYPDYSPTNWQGTLLVFACVAILFAVNVYGATLWSKIQNVLLVLHFALFVVVVVILAVKAPHPSARAVFLDFTNDGGWSSMGTALMVGQITAVYSVIGSDGTAHMSEEVQDAGRAVPISIFWSYTANSLMAIIFLITYLFAVESVEDALNDPSGYPFIYVFSQALPLSGVNALTILVMIIVFFANISFNASTARQTFAFARDGGLPFAKWIAYVKPNREVPVNSIILTCTITCLLALINIGSDVAFNAIISLQLVALMASYCISIGCVLYRRVAHPELLPHARWSLGRWGVLVNSIGLAYALFTFFWSFWPNTVIANFTDDFNWASVIFAGVSVFSLLMFVFSARKVYTGPVEAVRYARDE